MQLPNAKLTPLGRRRLVGRVVDEGLSLGQAARRSGVSKTTAWEWTTRRCGRPAPATATAGRACVTAPHAHTTHHSRPPRSSRRRSSTNGH